MVKTKKRTISKKKTQKAWKMHGCAKQQSGGSCNCGTMHGGKRRNKKGGLLRLSPSPFVNAPTLPADIQTWPGVPGSATGNWLTKNQYPVDLTDRTATQERGGQVFPMQMGGKKRGRRFSRGKKSKKGGAFPGLVNMGRSFGYGINSAYSNLVGSANMPVNPMPTADQFQKNN